MKKKNYVLYWIGNVGYMNAAHGRGDVLLRRNKKSKHVAAAIAFSTPSGTKVEEMQFQDKKNARQKCAGIMELTLRQLDEYFLHIQKTILSPQSTEKCDVPGHAATKEQKESA